MDDLSILGVALVSCLFGGCSVGFYMSRKMRRKVDYMLDALEDREINFRFDERKFFFRRFHHTLNRIRTLFEREKEEVSEQEHFFGQILEGVRTAVVVVNESLRREGRVLYCNSAALNLLGMATFSHVRQLCAVSEELQSLFENLAEGAEQRCSYYNEKGKITISMVAVDTCLQGQKVKILMFNDVTDEAAQHEEISWSKLIRVLTHEIMNTVTPIASLSHALATELTEENVDKQEMETGLATIYNASNGLINFVNNYRKLAHVATPNKTPFYVRELIDRVHHLTTTQVESAGAEWNYVEKSEDMLLYADVNQISQVLVNLVKNALQAGATLLKVTAEIDFAEAVVIRIFNNGHPIDRSNQEEIFVPFYTTKQEGTGIGLSLSRQIMRLHNGTLDLESSDEQGTTFRLTFR